MILSNYCSKMHALCIKCVSVCQCRRCCLKFLKSLKFSPHCCQCFCRLNQTEFYCFLLPHYSVSSVSVAWDKLHIQVNLKTNKLVSMVFFVFMGGHFLCQMISFGINRSQVPQRTKYVSEQRAKKSYFANLKS